MFIDLNLNNNQSQQKTITAVFENQLSGNYAQISILKQKTYILYCNKDMLIYKKNSIVKSTIT